MGQHDTATKRAQSGRTSYAALTLRRAAASYLSQISNYWRNLYSGWRA
jgi:hypothetical protein